MAPLSVCWAVKFKPILNVIPIRCTPIGCWMNIDSESLPLSFCLPEHLHRDYFGPGYADSLELDSEQYRFALIKIDDCSALSGILII